MATKSEILNNLREYSSDQIVEAINSGVVSIYELSKSGNLTPLMRKRIEPQIRSESVCSNQFNCYACVRHQIEANDALVMPL